MRYFLSRMNQSDLRIQIQEKKQGLADGSLGEGTGKKMARLSVRELASCQFTRVTFRDTDDLLTFAQCSASVFSNEDEGINMARSRVVWDEGIQHSDSLQYAIPCATL